MNRDDPIIYYDKREPFPIPKGAAVTRQPESNSQKVWVTDHGFKTSKKYHTDRNCHHLRQSAHKKNLSELPGYTPCKHCKGKATRTTSSTAEKSPTVHTSSVWQFIGALGATAVNLNSN